MYTRRNVWELGSAWADPILWYARGVAAMKARAIAEPTSWRFYAAMHGVDHQLWRELGHLKPSDPLPTAAVVAQFWKQCQHGSWYFLPWHRGYLLAFEANIRAAVVSLHGPADWALPYWNYFKTGQAQLPAEFASPDWPDGGTNPLYVAQRYGPNDDSNVHVLTRQVNLRALNDGQFTGVPNGGNPAFGGVDTGFSHSGQVHGGIETQPHDWVHGMVGGSNPKPPHLPGLMSDPDTAALDPIFWLHHANIDRLWASWCQGPPAHANPTQHAWRNGPASAGQRAFEMPMPDGTTWTYTPHGMVSLAALGYTYDDFAPRDATAPAAPPPAPSGGPDMPPDAGNVELVGANDESVTLRSAATSSVRLDSAMQQKVVANLAPAGAAAAPAAASTAPERVFLNLENVRGTSDASAFDVYVGVAAGHDVADHPELLAGSIAPFGVRKASQPDDEHGGQGLTFVLDITDIVSQLHAGGSLDAGELSVRLVPLRELPESAQLTVGRISIFRQGQ
jgi:tyrosinase